MTVHHFSTGEDEDAVLEKFAVQPIAGKLVALKTKSEIRASNETLEVYVVELPARAASAVVRVLRAALPHEPIAALQHLRRVIEPSFLPAPALEVIEPTRVSTKEGQDDTRILLVGPTSLIPQPELEDLLNANSPFSATSARPFPLVVHKLPVPTFPPISTEQAEAWTAQYWPVGYRNANPFGPHPPSVAYAAAEIEPKVGQWLAVAEEAAKQSSDKGLGERVGCIIVERRLDGNGRATEAPKLVAVAGDGRKCGLDTDVSEADTECAGQGNVMAHAVMRAIGMVGDKRLRIAKSQPPSTKTTTLPRPEETTPVFPTFAVEPRTEIESHVFARDNMTPGGYLCVDLEIYLTHEPCVMCSMAILHSRFNRCVFRRRMCKSGGMTADDKGLGHGLFWRPAELNWKFLCWNWKDDEEETTGKEVGVAETINA
ncbi:cytidine deaminase-like protein [Phyllosticta citribraziliensis]|uniref:Cytidine deaminase-like protein n=1 Tax=Phyllosticta citribraziliensis TaxID=989973 RepID=A0ABR1LFK1_9PEZI